MAEIFTLSNIVGAFINSFAHIYIWSELLDKKDIFKSRKYWLIQILFAIVLLLNYLLVSDFVKIAFLLLMLILFVKLLFNPEVNATILVSFISEILMMLSELVFILLIILLNTNSVNVLVDSYAGSLIVNLLVSVIAILASKIKYLKVLYKRLLKLSNNLKKYNIIIVMIVILISINFIFASIYNKITLSAVVIMNVLISSIYLIICFKFLTTQNKYQKINNKYNTTLNSLKEYEDVLDMYRVSNHENKNQLLTIRSMIVKGEKDIPKYIDKIIDNKIKDDEKLMFDTNKIPSGGLRATIYSKMLMMKELGIEFKLNVARKVRTVELIQLGEDIMLDICKVIGVFLDNSIEAVKDLEKKYIDISLITDDANLIIEISNNFEGSIDVNKIDDKGYTSKTGGHGYGLSLVKQIINSNSKLSNERRITKDIFSQRLIIKLK